MPESEISIKQAFQTALNHHRRGDLRQAEAMYRTILEAEPGHVDAYNDLGIALRGRGELDEAVVCYLKALRLKPDYAVVYQNLGNALRDQGLREEAALCYQRCAYLFRREGNAHRAIEASKHALEVANRQNDLSIRYQYAIALLRLNRHTEALDQLDQVRRKVEQYAAYARFHVEGKTVATVLADGEVLQFLVSPDAQNIGLVASHINGHLYEQDELTFCRSKVSAPGTIVDVGANVGNHLVYFAKVMHPKVIVPIEPHPEAIRQLRNNIALNHIKCVDCRYLGLGVGEAQGRYALVEKIDLAQASLAPSPEGGIEVFPLDDLIENPFDFVKIDVEGMEIEVLKGARRLISQYRPQIMIEVQKSNLEPFTLLVRELGYVVDREFHHHGYTNFFLVPGR